MEIQKINFGPKKYLAWKKSIKIADLTDRTMYDQGYGKLFGYIGANQVEVVGAGTMLYFKWDEAAGETDIALAMPVNNLGPVNDEELSMVEVPESKALMGELKGSYEGLKALHGEIMAKIREEKLENWLAIEEYVTDPSKTKTEDLITRVYYLYR